jgi:hypothetical protein
MLTSQQRQAMANMEAGISAYHNLVAQERASRSTRIKFHPAQAQVKREARRFNVLDCGRRWGKSLYLGDGLIEVAEQGFPTGYFAPSYKLLTETWRELLNATEGIRTGQSVQEHRIEFANNGVIECWSLDSEGGGSDASRKRYKAGRSRKYKRVAIDEAAMVPALENVFNYAIAPTLIDLEGDAWFGSTPNGKGAFYRFWLKGQEGSILYDPDWMSWKMPTSSNPYIPISEIERARRTYPDHVFRQEYLAEFLEDSGQVFRNITACTFPKFDILRNGSLVKGIWREKLEPYHVYVISWDLAKKNDFSVLCVIDCTNKRLVHMDRFNQVEYMIQVPRLIALAERFQPVEVVVEQNGNEALMEMLRIVKYQKKGPPPRIQRIAGFDEEQIMLAEAALQRLYDWSGINTTHAATMPITEFVASNASKEEAIQALVLAFERGEISIPDDPILLGELESFGMERLPSGRFRYSAPEGEHDDTVMSLAEGWYRARRYMSIEALPLREKAIRSLQPELHPDNIAANPNPMAQNSADYWIKSFEAKERSKGKHFMNRMSGFGR